MPGSPPSVASRRRGGHVEGSGGRIPPIDDLVTCPFEPLERGRGSRGRAELIVDDDDRH
jgi:hypothetical protein